MVYYKVLTLFPQIIENYIENNAPLKRGISKKLISIQSINFRDFSLEKHHKVDDLLYGGGPGLLLSPEPLIRALKDHKNKNTKLFFMQPGGIKLDNKLAKSLSEEDEILLVCGRYEGFDQRILDFYPDAQSLSLGDFILTGGEIAALAVIDSSARFIDGTLDSYESQEEESFNKGWLEHPQYTRPREFEGSSVPEVLFGGNHKKIEEWKLKNSIKNTIKNRPDILKSLNLNDIERNLIKEIIKEIYYENK